MKGGCLFLSLSGILISLIGYLITIVLERFFGVSPTITLVSLLGIFPMITFVIGALGGKAVIRRRYISFFLTSSEDDYSLVKRKIHFYRRIIQTISEEGRQEALETLSDLFEEME